jgi:hypothetical protein
MGSWSVAVPEKDGARMLDGEGRAPAFFVADRALLEGDRRVGAVRQGR